MKICIGCDHRGIDLKERLKAFLDKEGCTVVDKGTSSEESADYPDFGALVSKDVSQGVCDRGVLICSTGVGMSVVANKFPSRESSPLCGCCYSQTVSRAY